jgi:hypothetical protein
MVGKQETDNAFRDFRIAGYSEVIHFVFALLLRTSQCFGDGSIQDSDRRRNIIIFFSAERSECVTPASQSDF